MKRTLRKTFASGSITYTTRNFSNNLTGTNFVGEVVGDSIRVYIDLSSNLNARNKESNCVYDVNELIEDRDKLKSVQLDEEQVISKLRMMTKDNPDVEWVLIFSIGDMGTLSYSVTKKYINGSLFFYVISMDA